MRLKKLIPMLNVGDIRNSISFYSKAFGFEVVSDLEAVTEWRWATIRSGDTELMLSESEGSPNLKQGINPHEFTDWPNIFYFYPDDVEKLHNHLIENGFTPSNLEITFYGMKEFSIQDPDGHILSFGQEIDE